MLAQEDALARKESGEEFKAAREGRECVASEKVGVVVD